MPRTETITRCHACSGLNAHGLRFCLFCGTGLEGSADVRLAIPRPCQVCSVVDALSNKFCVNCGADMTIIDRANRILSSSESEEVYRNLQQRKQTGRQKKKNSGLNSGFAAALVACTVLSGIYALAQYQIGLNTGLLVHAEPIGSTVTVEDKRGYVVQSALIDKHGEVKILGLKPGNYQISVSHVGYEDIAQEVCVLPNKVLAVGIPKTIALVPEERVSQERKSAEAANQSEGQRGTALSDERSIAGTDEPKQAKSSGPSEHISDASPDTRDVRMTAEDEVKAADQAQLSGEQTFPAAMAAMARQIQQRAEQERVQSQAQMIEQRPDYFEEESSQMPERHRFANFARRFPGKARKMGFVPPRRFEHADPSEAPAPPLPAYQGQ